MKELVEFLAKNIVAEPSDVRVEETRQENGEIIKLSVNLADMGKIIGRSGRIIKAIRGLLRIKAIKEGRRVYLELTEQSPQEQ